MPRWLRPMNTGSHATVVDHLSFLLVACVFVSGVACVCLLVAVQPPLVPAFPFWFGVRGVGWVPYLGLSASGLGFG